MARRAVIQRFLQLKLKTYFFAGLLVVGPIALTFMVVQWIVTGLDSFLAGLLPTALHPDRLLGFHVPGLGLIAGVLIILLAGILAANYLGKERKGFRQMVPEEDTVPLAVTVDEAFKLVISGGMVTPKGKKGAGRSKAVEAGK
jgi:uncharacterized membrane protein